MKHLDDLNLYDFIDLIQHFKECEATLKIDGTCAITFGFDEFGKFYTSFGRDFKTSDPSQRKFSKNDWLKRKIIMVNPGIFTHLVLEKHLSILRQFIKNNEPVVAEILLVEQPNCVRYKLGGINRIIILNNNQLSCALEGIIGSIMIPEYYIKDFDIFKKLINHSYKFESIPHCKIPDINLPIHKIINFLNEYSEGTKNSEIYFSRAAGKNKQIIQDIRKKIEILRMEIKDKLIGEFVSICTGHIEVESGYNHEGVVLSYKNQLVKLIDKNNYTKIHENDWKPAKDAKKIRIGVITKEISQKEGIIQILNLLNNFESIYSLVSKDMIERMKDQLRMTFIEIRSFK